MQKRKRESHIENKNTLNYKAKQFMLTKTIRRKNLHILEDDASGVQVGDTEQAIVYNLFAIQ